MDSARPRAEMDCEKFFLSSLISGFTHELRNHLAVIRETAGLQQDLIEIEKAVNNVPAMAQALRSIDSEVVLLSQLAAFLNRFSHRMESDWSLFCIQEVLEELVALVTRSADEKHVALKTDFAPDLPPVAGNPARLQMLIFFLLDEKLRSLEQGSSVLVRIGGDPAGIMITIIPQGRRHPDAVGRCPQEVLLSAARDIGAELSAGDAERETSVLLKQRRHSSIADKSSASADVQADKNQ